ncbi:MAG: OadG family protein [Actinomycetales bacterium]|nr:OadG family protein [Actinomycetales bacterium]
MIGDGLVITLAGMLVAFVFLGLMALTTSAVSRVVRRWEPEEHLPADRPDDDDAALAVAIAAAWLRG